MTWQRTAFNEVNDWSLSADDIVNQINGEILRIFGVNSKYDIAVMETKEILAKLDSVFKVREDNQPHVDFPVSVVNLFFILIHNSTFQVKISV